MHGCAEDKTLQLFNRFIAKQMGLHFKEERLFELRQKCASLCREFGYQDLQACLLWLMSAPLSRQQLDVLARSLTIGETYFLRDPASYRILEEELLPKLIASRRGKEKRLRIWSAGCSSREEPYSIAILLTRLIPDLKQWEIELLATDINPQVLEKGRRGIYSQWSFRDAPPWLLEYFQRRPDGSMEILPRIRKMVRFTQLNLAEASYPSALSGTCDLDIIFCRNVMLYFAPELIQQTVLRFHDALTMGGLLFVSPTEVDHRFFTPFNCKRYPGTFVFEKEVGERDYTPLPREESRAVVGSGVMHIGESGLVPDSPVGWGVTSRTLSDEAMLPISPLSPAPEAGAGDGFAPPAYDNAQALEARARELADQGLFEEAKRCCESAIALDRLRPGCHYLLSLVLSEQGEFGEAETALKRALYLDHEFILAYLALGNLKRQVGRNTESQRYFTNALRLLEKRNPDEMLTELDGMTAGGLAAMIRMQGRMLNVQ